MKKILLPVLIALAAYQLWGKFSHAVPVDYEKPYVAVYGRDSCGYTQKMLSDLKGSGVTYHYFIVDDRDVAEILHSKMQASGISITYYNLPVVDVNGKILVRPKFKEVIKNYREEI